MYRILILMMTSVLLTACVKQLPDCDDREIQRLIADRVLGDQNAPIEFATFEEDRTAMTWLNPTLEKACIASLTTGAEFRELMQQVNDYPALSEPLEALTESEIRLFLGSEAIKSWLDFIPDSNPHKTKIFERYALTNLLISFKKLHDQYEENDQLHFTVHANPEMNRFQIEFADDDLDDLDEFFRYRSDAMQEFKTLLLRFKQDPEAPAVIEALSHINDRVQLEQYTRQLAAQP